MQQQRRKFLITLFSSVATVCAVAAGVVGYLLLNPPSTNPVRAAGENWYIEYHSNGGMDGERTTAWLDNEDSTTTYDADTEVVRLQKLSIIGFNRYGYAFDGWSLGSGTINIEDEDTPDKDNPNRQPQVSAPNIISEMKDKASKNGGVLKLYAKWLPKKYTLTFNALDGEFDPDGVSNSSGEFTISEDNKTVVRNVDYHYNEEAYAGMMSNGQEQFEPNIGGGGDDNPIFAGWFLDYDDETYEDEEGDSIRTMIGTRMVTLTDNRTMERNGSDRAGNLYPFDTLADNKITLYAHYNAGEYKINYFLNAPWSGGVIVVNNTPVGRGTYRGPHWTDADGGQHNNDPKFPGLGYTDDANGPIVARHMVSLNAPWTLLTDSPYVIAGYKFMGWYMDDSEEARGLPGANANNDLDKIYKAGVEPDSGELDKNKSIPGVQVINLAKSKFTSDADKANMDWQMRASEGRIDLYARWEPIRYTIKYDIGSYGARIVGNNNIVTNATYDALTTEGLQKNNFYANTGYTFFGWTRYSDGGDGFIVDYNADKGGYTGPGAGEPEERRAYIPGIPSPGDERYVFSINLTEKDGAVVRLFPVWMKSQYHVKFMLDGGTLTAAAKSPTTFPGGIIDKPYDLNASFPSLSHVVITDAGGQPDENYVFIGWYAADMQNKGEDEDYIDALIRSMGYQGNGNGFMNFDEKNLPVLGIEGSLSYAAMTQELIDASPGQGNTAENPIVLWARYIKLRGSLIIHSKLESINGDYDDFNTGATPLIDPGAIITEGVYINSDAYDRGNRISFRYFDRGLQRSFDGQRFELVGLYYDAHYTKQDTGFLGSYYNGGLWMPTTAADVNEGSLSNDYFEGHILRKNDIYDYDNLDEYGNPALVKRGAFVGWVDYFNGQWVIPAEFAGARLTLYAEWEVAKMTNDIIYVFGDNVAISDVKLDSRQPFTFEYSLGAMVRDPGQRLLTDPQRDGYEFMGWYRDLDKDGIPNYDPIDEVTSIMGGKEESDVTLYAKWESKRYTVKYLDDDGGDIDESTEITFDPNDDDDENLPEITRFGYDFDGWYYQDNDGEMIKIIAYEDVNGDKPFDPKVNGFNYQAEYILYAQWTPIKYMVELIDPGVRDIDSRRYYALDGTLGDRSTYESNIHEYSKGTSLPGVGNDIQRIGYNFDGWWWSATFENGDKVSVLLANMAETDLRADGKRIILYAKWIPKSYSINYYDGVFSPAGGEKYWLEEETAFGDTAWDDEYIEYVYPQYLTLPRADMNFKPGFDFAGWYMVNSSRLATLVVNDTLSLTEATVSSMADDAIIKLYARWRAEGINIVYETGGGALPAGAPQQYYIDTGINELPTPTRTGHTFMGWFFVSNPLNRITSLPMGAYVSVPTDGKTVLEPLIARWIVEEYKVGLTINDEGARIGSDYNYVVGWDTNKDSITDEDGRMPLLITELKHTYTAETLLPWPVRTHFDFQGWYENPELTGNRKELFEANAFDFGSNGDEKKLYAKWTPKTYNINYYGTDNSNNTSINSAKYTYGLSQVLLNPTKPGYTFLGWYNYDEVTQGKTGNMLPAVGIQTGTYGDISVYADWKVNQYTINVIVKRDGDEEQIATNDIKYIESGIEMPFSTSITHTYDTITQLKFLLKKGYEFAGWFRDAGMTDEIEIDPNTNTANIGAKEIDDEHRISNIYAKFIWIKYRIEYEHAQNTLDIPYATIWNGSQITGAFPDLRYQYGGNLITNLPVIARPGYIFVGWYLRLNGSTTASTVTNIGGGALNTVILPNNVSTGDGYDAQGNESDTGIYGVYTLLSQWRAKTYTLDIDSAGFTPTAEQEENAPLPDEPHKFGESTILPNYVGMRVGYNFDGWFFEDEEDTKVPTVNGRYTLDAHTDYDDKSNIVGNIRDLKIHAEWTLINYEITYKYVHEFYDPNDTEKFSAPLNWRNTYTVEKNTITLPSADAIPTKSSSDNGNLNVGFVIMNGGAFQSYEAEDSVLASAGGIVIYIKYYTIIKYVWADLMGEYGGEVAGSPVDLNPKEYIYKTTANIDYTTEHYFVSGENLTLETVPSDIDEEAIENLRFTFIKGTNYGTELTLYVYHFPEEE